MEKQTTSSNETRPIDRQRKIDKISIVVAVTVLSTMALLPSCRKEKKPDPAPRPSASLRLE
jgi:hypothetical protein